MTTTAMIQTTVYYHAGCADGFTAAYYVRKVMGDEHTQYVAKSYGEPLVEHLESGHIVFVDFSPKVEVYEAMVAQVGARDVVILDHHESARRELAVYLDEPTVHIDEAHCGAYWTWFYFHSMPPRFEPITPGAHEGEVPQLVQYIEDRDCWRWELSDSREISAYISSLDKTWWEWETLERQFEFRKGVDALVMLGTSILRAHHQLVERIVAKRFVGVLGGASAVMVNTPVLQSEVGERLLELEPDVSMAAVWHVDSERQQESWSLRSRGDFDVSKVAEQFGGGGHPAAAGFSNSASLHFRSG